MKAKTTLIITLLALTALFLSACDALPGQSNGDTEPTPIPTVVADTQVLAEGRLVPDQFVNLSFKAGGQVAEVLVQEGDTVSQDQVVARLSNREQLEVALANAELELLNAQLALKALFDKADVNTALARQEVTDAQDAVRDAERYLNNLAAGSRQTDIDSVRADVIILKDKLDDAREDYQPYENKSDDNLKRATFLSKLADAQRKYDDTVRLLNNLQGSASELDTAIAEANLSVAQAQLALAETNFEELKDGPDPDQLASAEARIFAAETGLAAAQANLDNIELTIPFSGTLVDLNLKVGEQVSPGQPVLVLADFSQWMVETDDLTEIEVPEIYLDQPVTVSPDALPDLELSGSVDSVSDLFEDKRGDVTYTAHIKLDETDPRLRWGMTVVVIFEE